MDIINTCLAYAYDVTTVLPSLKQGTGPQRRPRGILLQELDLYIDELGRAIEVFGRTTTDALEGAVLTELEPDEAGEVDVMPRDEVFLISSFMLNLRRAASHTLDMMVCARRLVEVRQERGRRRLWFPKIKVRKWLGSGVEEGEGLGGTGGREGFLAEGGGVGSADSDYGASRETLSLERRRKERRERTWRETVADSLEWVAGSGDVLYAFKLTLGVMLCSWPAFVENWAEWFYYNRGVWVGLIFILVFENAVGSTIWIFALRAVGTVFGSVWGFAAYKARSGNGVVIVVMIMLAAIPSYYVQLGTKYMKAGMVCTISMCVVAVSTHLQTVPGECALLQNVARPPDIHSSTNMRRVVRGELLQTHSNNGHRRLRGDVSADDNPPDESASTTEGVARSGHSPDQQNGKLHRTRRRRDQEHRQLSTSL